jgi:hypothetical protein
MLLAKSIMLRSSGLGFSKIFLSAFLLASTIITNAQDNSPYSRYGLGDLAPATNITSRGMGSISAGYADVISINFNNPASYSQFQAFIEQRSKKVSGGRVILDVGMNFDNRTLVAPNTTNRFTSADAYFSYLQVGLPIRKNWGLSFGLRPISRISYLINRFEQLKDPTTGMPIDSAITQFKGSGGSYLPSIGTGVGFTMGTKETGTKSSISTLSLGANVGYLFGSRENTTLRSLINDSILYYSSDHTMSSSFGDLFYNGGLQYQVEVTDKIKNRSTAFRFGLAGNLQQNLKASQDVLRQTFSRGAASEILQIDSVYQQSDVKGEVVYPASVKAGFVVQRTNNKDNSGWMFGADFTTGKWSNYRFFGQRDSVQDNWMVNAGGQFYPKQKTSYFSKVVYRFGVFAGSDYIKLQDNLPQFGVSFGMGLPLSTRSVNRFNPNQYSIVNLALEYVKRGSNDNLMKENLFRVSIGLNFTDLWFGKKKYD